MTRKISLLLFSGMFLLILNFSCSSEIMDHSNIPELLLDSPHQKNKNILYYYADSLKYIGNYSFAAKEFQKILEDSNNLSDDNSLHIFNQLTYCFLKNRNLKSAKELLYSTERKIYKNADNELVNPNSADYYFNLGLLAFAENEGQNALTNFRKAKNIYEKIYPENHYRNLLTKTNLALAYRFYSLEVETFLSLAENSFEILNETSELLSFSSEILYSYAHACWFRRAEMKGENVLNIAIENMENASHPDTLFWAKCLSLRGKMLAKQPTKLRLAEADYLKAIELAKSINYSESIFYNDYLVHLAFQKEEGKFFNYLQILEKNKDYASFGIFPERLQGLYFYLIQDYGKAIQFYEIFLKFYEKEIHPNITLLDESYFVLIDAYTKMNQFDKAEKTTLKLIRLISGKAQKKFVWKELFHPEMLEKLHLYVSYHLLAKILIKKFQQEKQVQTLEKAHQLYKFIDKMIYARLDSFDEDAWLSFTQNYSQDIYTKAVEVSYELYRLNTDNQYLESGLHFMERLKSPLLFRELAGNFSNKSATVPDHILRKEKELNQIINELKSRGQEKEKLAKVIQEKEVFFKDLEQNFPIYYHTKIQQPLPELQEIQSKSEKQTLILNFLCTDQNIFVALLEEKSTAFQRIEIPKDFEEKIYWLKSFLAGKINHYSQQNIDKYLKIGFEIYQILLLPFEKYFKETEKILIIPHHFLDQFPFEVLLTKRANFDSKNLFTNLPFLIKNYSTSYSPSLKSVFNSPKKDKISPKNILAYAFSEISENDFQLALRSNKLSELPGTALEINAIRTHFPTANSQLKFGKNSTKQHFLENCEKEIDLLHLALHAQSDNSNRLNNVLFFPGKPPDSLFGFEIAAKNISAKLALLTSCQTAFGKREAGEGTYSLSRAFLQAGVPQVIASFWEIEDQSTAKIINLFYENLKTGKSPVDALRIAKIKYLAQAGGHRGHPNLWAGLGSLGR